MSESETVLVALGGNALQAPDSEGTYDQQIDTVEATADILIEVIETHDEVILTHGNGPQIGRILRQNIEAADVTPPMPLFANGAQTQGLIGFMIQSALMSKLTSRPSAPAVVPLVTPVAVDPADPAFDEPTKPIGPYLPEADAEALRADQDLTFKHFPDHGYRQVVPSPDPQHVYGGETVAAIVDRGDIPIVAGGGGVPIAAGDGGAVRGVNAVIDKDLTGALLGTQLGADVFVILTNVAQVALNYGEPDEEPIEAMTVSEARTYMEAGHFARGSMYEKVEAACRFVEDDPSRRAVITDLELAAEALDGTAGTQIEAVE